MPRLRSKRGASTPTPSGPTARSAGVRRTSLPRSLGVLAGPGPLAPTRVLNPRTSHYPCSGIWGQVSTASPRRHGSSPVHPAIRLGRVRSSLVGVALLTLLRHQERVIGD